MASWIRRAACAAVLLGGLAGGGARAECRFGLLAQLPVTMEGSRPLIHASINGKDALFLADSGAFFNVMSMSRAKALDLMLSPMNPRVEVTGVGGDVRAMVGTAQKFTLAGADFRYQEFVVGGGEATRGAIGVIGRNILQVGDAEYDLADGAIRLFNPHGCERYNLAYWTKPPTAVSEATIHWDKRTDPILVDVQLNGRPMKALLDTGASTSVIAAGAAARAGVKPGDAGVEPAGFIRGEGRGLVKTWIGPFASLKIGDEEIKTTRLRFSDLSDREWDMILGADFFLSHRVYVANSQHRLYFTYNGGPVFDLRVRTAAAAAEEPASAPAQAPARTEAAAAPGPSPALSAGGAKPGALTLAQLADPGEPTDAEGFSRRAGARAARGEVAPALADASRAVELAPNEPRYLEQRARLHLAARQPLLAMSDFDAVLRLKPDDVGARLARAQARLSERDGSDARADLDAVAALPDKGMDERLPLAGLYTEADAFDAAVRQYDLWIAAHPDDSRRGGALNGRCWARALGGLEPDKAVADCNAALRTAPAAANYLDSRGLAYLRKGELDRAAADFDAALKINPRLAWSLYGRGVARARKGDKAGADADLAAAQALAPRVVERAKRLGLTA